MIPPGAAVSLVAWRCATPGRTLSCGAPQRFRVLRHARTLDRGKKLRNCEWFLKYGTFRVHGTVPEFRGYHRRMWAGEVDLADNVKIVYGRVHWERLLQNVRRARYNEALRIVSDRNAIP